jgi:asparagine synthase (glutamine-hydrolysing)
MCGLLFLFQKKSNVSDEEFKYALSLQSWRGPDNSLTKRYLNGRVLAGHNRLSILDVSHGADQPMTSDSGRYCILFNGEIYNHKELRNKYKLVSHTSSDTETVLELYEKIGEQVFDVLNGMFALVIFDLYDGSWIAARDEFGIKPLFIYDSSECTIISSECISITKLKPCDWDELSISEWKMFRRPMPGKTYFKSIEELLPGHLISSSNGIRKYFNIQQHDELYSQEKFDELVYESIYSHMQSDVSVTSLLSGGLDSSVICAISKVDTAYTIGLDSQNEIFEAQANADEIGVELSSVILNYENLKEVWRKLIKIRGEPLSVPNEGLIYSVCDKMKKNEKVVLTGEGADELLFGYDRIYRTNLMINELKPADFLQKYSYSTSEKCTSRMLDFAMELAKGKSAIEFTEDFFYNFHLLGLLRRMDFASMVASKEARVPFVNKKLVQYMYRRPAAIRMDQLNSKLPLRSLAAKVGLKGVLSRKKVGFSATPSSTVSASAEYENFQSVVFKELSW